MGHISARASLHLALLCLFLVFSFFNGQAVTTTTKSSSKITIQTELGPQSNSERPFVNEKRVFVESYPLFRGLDVSPQVKGQRPYFMVPHGWEPLTGLKKSSISPPSPRMTVTIALKQRNMKEAEAKAKLVSNPRSKEYRQYLSRDELIEWIKPNPEVVLAVKRWLMGAGINDIELTYSQDFLIARGTAKQFGELLDVDFDVFVHKKTGTKVVRALELYTVPTSIAPLIDYIGGVNRFPKISTKARESIYSVDVRSADDDLPEDLPPGNAPIISSIIPGDTEISTFFLVRCFDGTTTTDPKALCTLQHMTIESAQVTISNQDVLETTFTATTAELECRQCLNWTTGWHARGFYCNKTVNKYNLSPSTVFCSMPIVGNIRNYLPNQVSLTLWYSNQMSSAAYQYPNPVYTGMFVTPQVLTRRYRVPPGLVATNSNTTQAVAEFLGQYYSPADLTQFFNLMGQPDQPVNVIGPNDPSNPGGEASLDIQYIMGVAPNVTTTFWSLGGLHDGQEPFDQWMTQVLNAPDVAMVHSVSYGDDENSLSTEYMNRVNNEFIKSTLYGLSILFASGDNGVASSNASASGQSCPNNHWVPSFPPTSPWVTAVGATQFSTQTTAVCEKAASGVPIRCDQIGEIMSSTTTGSRITSGGGFSDVFKRPEYQEQVVTAYIKKSLSNIPSGWYNPQGRAYPDVAACGRNYVVVLGGELVPVDGTSAATPVFAALVSLLNDVLLNNHQKPLGFLNPLIYQVGMSDSQAFFDIVMGNNRCPEDLSQCCQYGLPAAVGWDAVTGFGTPNFERLLEWI